MVCQKTLCKQNLSLVTRLQGYTTFSYSADHGQVQSGQTAVSSKILATTTAVYNEIKAYNNLTRSNISLKNFNSVNSVKIVLVMGTSGETF